ncbi:MAG: hypothetical protein HC874_07290 [Richelia sp. SL_2_1]|nr:hypothetical protein [Richelia sp. RM1_1_1]NJO27367.1 hypothetical protein [Richelia sp. SL_2_1]
MWYPIERARSRSKAMHPTFTTEQITNGKGTMAINGTIGLTVQLTKEDIQILFASATPHTGLASHVPYDDKLAELLSRVYIQLAERYLDLLVKNAKSRYQSSKGTQE